MALPALSGSCNTLSGVFPTEVHCYVSACFFHMVMLLGELEGSSSVCGKAMKSSFALFGTLFPAHCSLSPTTTLSTEGTFYLEIQVLISYRNPSTTIRWQWIHQCSPPGTSQTREAALLSITHPPSQPTLRFVLDKYDQEAEALSLFPDAFH